MHAVSILNSFIRAANEAGMSEDEIEKTIDFIAENPTAGNEIRGTGGCRKLRIPGRGKGKSGGYRVVTFYTGEALPVFLITVFSKGDSENLSGSERNDLKKMTASLASEYGRKVAKVANKGTS